MMPAELKVCDNTMFRDLWASAMKNWQIAKILGISASTLGNAGRRFGLQQRPCLRSKRLTDAANAAYDLYNVTGEVTPALSPDPKDPSGRVLGVPPRLVVRTRPSLPLTRGLGWSSEHDAAILTAGGSYRANARLAKQWNMQSAKVLARWHQLRAQA